MDELPGPPVPGNPPPWWVWLIGIIGGVLLAALLAGLDGGR